MSFDGFKPAVILIIAGVIGITSGIPADIFSVVPQIKMKHIVVGWPEPVHGKAYHCPGVFAGHDHIAARKDLVGFFRLAGWKNLLMQAEPIERLIPNAGYK